MPTRTLAQGGLWEKPCPNEERSTQQVNPESILKWFLSDGQSTAQFKWAHFYSEHMVSFVHSNLGVQKCGHQDTQVQHGFG